VGKCTPKRLKLAGFTVMDMAGMSDMFMPTAPATSATDASADNGGAMEGMMMMQMWFQATTKVTLWFREWSIDSHSRCVALLPGSLWGRLGRSLVGDLC
jgi:hypothetical protein